MFVFSVKATKKQRWMVLVCLSVMALIGVGVCFFPTAITTGAVPARKGGTEDERIALLTSLGLEVDGTPQVYELRLPDESDPVLEQYNALLQQAEMDLSPYFGKRIKVYTYRVSGGETGVAAARLYLYKDKVIAGDIAPLSNPTAIKPLF